MLESAKITSIQVTNFRNLADHQILFDKKINCIWGKNGNGKTNLLEAIFLIANNKSFRKNTSFPQLLDHNGDKTEIYFQVKLENDLNKEQFFYSGKWSAFEKTIYLNGFKEKAKQELSITIFNPFDSYIFFNELRERRAWFDTHINLIDMGYRNNLKLYNKIICIKNALLLKQSSASRDQIKQLNKQLVAVLKGIFTTRKKFLKSISNPTSLLFKKIFSENIHISIDLTSSINFDSEEALLCELNSKIDFEYSKGLSVNMLGLQKINLFYNGLDASLYGSLGQQKMGYFCLNLSYIELFYQLKGHFPIVLIDDISGELDSDRWKGLLSYLALQPFQVIFTTANEELREYVDNVLHANIFQINDGSIDFRT